MFCVYYFILIIARVFEYLPTYLSIIQAFINLQFNKNLLIDISLQVELSSLLGSLASRKILTRTKHDFLINIIGKVNITFIHKT